MPSAISHIIAGASLGYSLYGGRRRVFFFFLAAFISILPDLDVLAFGFGIPYGDIFGHRVFFHSLVFSVIVSLALVLLYFRGRDFSAAERARIFAILFIIAASHPVLDAMTGAGWVSGCLSQSAMKGYFYPGGP
jgi:inner membrane protein